MNDGREKFLRQQGFGFFGIITASLSHEMNNVFATINELSGLLDDFFCAAERGAPLNLEKLKVQTQRISAQIKRGQRYVKRLNKFAHTIDNNPATVVINETVEAITTLCRRFGTLGRVKLETGLPETKISSRLEGSEFDLQHIIFRCTDIVLGIANQGDVINIDMELKKGEFSLVFTGPSAVKSLTEVESKQKLLRLLVTEMKGVVESVIKIGQPVRLAVFFPTPLNN